MNKKFKIPILKAEKKNNYKGKSWFQKKNTLSFEPHKI